MPVLQPSQNVVQVVLAGAHHVEQLLAFFAQAMPRHRYHLEARGPNWLRASKGQPYGQDALHRPHAFVVESDGSGARLTFEYNPVVRVPPGEAMQLERYATAWLSDFNSYAIGQSFQQGPPSQAYGPPSHVVERQVVVVRCKFCQAHTPLDGPRCASCGAERFS